MHAKLLLLTLALLAVPATAQPGPQPGYDSALEYAAEYAQDETGQAASSPEQYLMDHASESALRNETSHTAYVACWAADDAGVEHDACDAYYTPRGEEQPDQPACECNATDVGNETEQFAADAGNQTEAFAGNATAFANATLEDPANATAHAGGFLNTTVMFVKDAVGGAVDFVVWFAEGVLTGIGIGFSTGMGAWEGAGAALGDIGSALGDAGQLGATTVGDLTGDMAQGMGSGFGTLGSALATAFGAIGDVTVSVFTAIGSGLAAAASATGNAIATVGHAIGDAAVALKDAVVNMFDGPSNSPGLDDATDDLVPDVDTGSLLDPVTGLLA